MLQRGLKMQAMPFQRPNIQKNYHGRACPRAPYKCVLTNNVPYTYCAISKKNPSGPLFPCDSPAPHLEQILAQEFTYPPQELQNIFQIQFSCSFALQIPKLHALQSRFVARAAFWTFCGRCLCFYGRRLSPAPSNEVEFNNVEWCCIRLARALWLLLFKMPTLSLDDVTWSVSKQPSSCSLFRWWKEADTPSGYTSFVPW